MEGTQMERCRNCDHSITNHEGGNWYHVDTGAARCEGVGTFRFAEPKRPTR